MGLSTYPPPSATAHPVRTARSPTTSSQWSTGRCSRSQTPTCGRARAEPGSPPASTMSRTRWTSTGFKLPRRSRVRIQVRPSYGDADIEIYDGGAAYLGQRRSRVCRSIRNGRATDTCVLYTRGRRSLTGYVAVSSIGVSDYRLSFKRLPLEPNCACDTPLIAHVFRRVVKVQLARGAHSEVVGCCRSKRGITRLVIRVPDAPG